MSIITVHFHFRGPGRLDVSVDRVHDTGKTWTNPLGTVIKKMESQRGWARRKDIPMPTPGDDRTALYLAAKELVKLVQPGGARLNYLDEDELLDFPWPAAS
jgi:hypothetical protein